MFFYFLVDKFSFMAELITLEALLCRFSERRKNFFFRSAVTVMILLTCCWVITQFLARAFPYSSFVAYFLMYILSAIGISVCFKIGFWGVLFVSVSGYALQNATYNLYRIVKALLIPESPKIAGYILHLVLFALLFVAVLFLTKDSEALIKNAGEKSKTNKFLLLAGVALIFSVTFLDTRGLTYIRENNKMMARIFQHLCIMIIGMLVVMLQFCALREKKGQKELDRIKQILHLQKKVYLDNKELLECINIRFHDLKHQLLNGGNYMTDEQKRQAVDALGAMDLLFDTGNRALDTVLTEKGLRCFKENIGFTCLLEGENLRFLSESDIYSLFGNALDNAIAAVINLPQEKRFISITENRNGNLLGIQIENCYDGKIVFAEGLPKTQRDVRYHGFGVKSMKMIAEKYGGRLSVETKDDLFCVDIFLPIRSSHQ